LCPLIKRAKEDKIVLLFLDASHFVMGCDFLGCIYGKVRRFVKTFSGRKRYNVLGALNFISKKVTTVANETYITAAQVCELLTMLSEEYTGKVIHLILDNARYQKCEAVKVHAVSLGIILEYIPPYSPNLNLIERLWKYVKGKLRTKYYSDFELFQSRINSIVSSTDKEEKSAVDSLIGEKVQLFDNLTVLNENTLVDKKISSAAQLVAW
jgi:transposase